MPTFRKTVFTNGEIYHVFNRGVEKRNIFNEENDYCRCIETMKYYQKVGPKIRFSDFKKLSKKNKEITLEIYKQHENTVEILAYCLMPNHFHFLLRQIRDGGISRFISDISNSHSKYINTKYDRVGPLFQGPFKEVHIESEEQLMHVSRYIHLNPVSSRLIETNELKYYLWSSYPEYLNLTNDSICEKNIILNLFKSVKAYEEFVLDNVDYARELDKIKHLTIEL